MNILEPRHRLTPLPKPDREQVLADSYYRVADENAALARQLARVRAVAERNYDSQAMRQILNILEEA